MMFVKFQIYDLENHKYNNEKSKQCVTHTNNPIIVFVDKINSILNKI